MGSLLDLNLLFFEIVVDALSFNAPLSGIMLFHSEVTPSVELMVASPLENNNGNGVGKVAIALLVVGVSALGLSVILLGSTVMHVGLSDIFEEVARHRRVQAQVYELIRLREANRLLAIERQGGPALRPDLPGLEELSPPPVSSTSSIPSSSNPSANSARGVASHELSSISTTYTASGGEAAGLPDFPGGRPAAWGDSEEKAPVDEKGKGVVEEETSADGDVVGPSFSTPALQLSRGEPSTLASSSSNTSPLEGVDGPATSPAPLQINIEEIGSLPFLP